MQTGGVLAMTARRIGLAACILAAILLGVSLVTGHRAHGAVPVATVAASEAWVRLPAVAGRPAAAYLMLMGGDAHDALVAASSPAGARVELHSTSMAEGRMRMRPESRLAVPKGGMTMLEPGGSHLMLFGLDPAIGPGKMVPLELRFASGAVIRLSAEARAAGDIGPAGHQH
jgi:copper(I)-binding protein